MLSIINQLMPIYNATVLKSKNDIALNVAKLLVLKDTDKLHRWKIRT